MQEPQPRAATGTLRPLTVAEAERLGRLSAPYFQAEKAVDLSVEVEGVAERIDRDLRALCSERLDAAETDGDSPSRRLTALAAALGCLLVRELGLEWAASRSPGEDDSIEYVVRRQGTDIVFYPRRLILRQLRQSAPLPTLDLLDSTKRYFASLGRFFPASI